ncbi:MAG: hypothetical protein ACYCY1_02005 [Sulfuriferula sp.]
MANKTLNTRQKMVFQLPQQKPRNTAALALRDKRGGAHGKDNGAQRAALKRLLKLGENQ